MFFNITPSLNKEKKETEILQFFTEFRLKWRYDYYYHKLIYVRAVRGGWEMNILRSWILF